MGKASSITFREWIDSQGVQRLAKRLKVTEQTVFHWRRGHCFPRVPQLRLIRELSKGAITYEKILDREVVE